ncbi:hypothetical protein [Streptomyces uncialis]|uniref:hypothetical protein n=1 Tax=Streptomyces uncialis TaxID=1048205 RepID=UPI0037AE81A8
MKISLCKHHFSLPVNLPGAPGDCRRCGLSWDDNLAGLARQAEQVRLATAHEARCEHCAKRTVVFQFQREQQPWDEAEPPLLWLCQHCWSRAAVAVEETGFADFADAFERGSDTQLARLVGGVR